MRPWPWLAALVLALALALVSACPPDVPPELAARSPESAQLVSASYALCAVSPQCVRRFHLAEVAAGAGAGAGAGADPDWPLFAHLVDRLAVEMRLDVARTAAIACGDAGPEALYAWRLVLDNYAFCTENELPDERGGCVCRRDKTCHELPGEEFAFGRATYTLVVLVFVAAVLYYGVRTTRELAELRARQGGAPEAEAGAAITPTLVQDSEHDGAVLRHGAVPAAWRLGV